MIPLDTSRLSIRQAEVADRGFILQLLNNPSWLEYIGDKHIGSLKDAEDYITQRLHGSYRTFGFGLFVVELKAQSLPIGLCGLIKRKQLRNVDIGYAFLPEYWRRGYAYEAATKVLDHALEHHGLQHIVAITLPGNLACIGLLTKLGFIRRREISIDEEVLDLYEKVQECHG